MLDKNSINMDAASVTNRLIVTKVPREVFTDLDAKVWSPVVY